MIKVVRNIVYDVTKERHDMEDFFMVDLEDTTNGSIVTDDNGTRWQICNEVVTSYGNYFAAYEVPTKATHVSKDHLGLFYYMDGGKTYRWSQTLLAWDYVGHGTSFTVPME